MRAHSLEFISKSISKALNIKQSQRAELIYVICQSAGGCEK